MPNLNYDPQNPTDLLDRPIAEGDVVAWGTTYGRSAALAVCVIEKIRFYRTVNSGAYSTKRVTCPQGAAEGYTLRLRPIKSTGRVTDEEYVPGGIIDPETGERKFFRKLDKAKSKTVLLVKNVVKLEAL